MSAGSRPIPVGLGVRPSDEGDVARVHRDQLVGPPAG